MIRISPLPYIEKFILLEDYVLDLGYKGKILVPVGFTYDGASIPQAAWSVLSSNFNPSILRAALIHDFLYTTKQFSRKNCDKILLDLMLEDGIKLWKAKIIYKAVRLFGNSYYKRGKYENFTSSDRHISDQCKCKQCTT